MRVMREDVRKLVAAKLEPALRNMRVKWPGMVRVDIEEDKSAYANVDLVYTDADQIGVTKDSKDRVRGTIVVEFNFKEGSTDDLILVNGYIEEVIKAISKTDDMYPVRTYVTKQVSPTAIEAGWIREGLVTPFWFDTSR